MEKPFKFLLPSPNFVAKANESKPKPHFLTPSGMTLLPREKQPPPMYGKRGATVPSRFLHPAASLASVPEPVKQYCEPCELELASFEDLKHHRAQHEKCPVEGCLYRGHPTVMDKHVTALHNSGLFEKFKKLSTPEEIAAWREERRKRYPTVQNVLLKQKAQEQRQKRGERLETNKNRFGKQDDRKRALPNNEPKKDDEVNPKNRTQGNRNKSKRKKRNNQNKKEGRQQVDTLVEKSEVSGDEETTCPRFRGTLDMKDYKHLDNKCKAPENALSGLLGMYGSDDEETDKEDSDYDRLGTDTKHVDISGDHSSIDKSAATTEEAKDLIKNGRILQIDICDIPEEKVSSTNENESKASKSTTIDSETISKIKEHTSSGREDDTSTQNQYKSQDQIISSIIVDPNSSDEGPEETAIERSIPEYKISCEKQNATPSELCTVEPKQKSSKQTDGASKVKQIVKRKSGLDYRKAKVRKQNTMLEKLLEADIRHERNVLLQCVRFVCESNFFSVAKPTSSSNTAAITP